MDPSSQIDPLLDSAAPIPLSTELLPPLGISQHATPNSSNPTAPKNKAQRSRRTNAQMIVWRSEQTKLNRARAEHRQMARIVKEKAKPSPKKKKSTTTTSYLDSSKNSDRGKNFVYEDFENICSYLENSQHRSDLFGEGEKTSVGAAKLTKSKAFEYVEAKNFEEGTGAGILDKDGPQTLAEVLDGKCPCFDRIDAIYREKPNVIPMLEFDHSQPAATLPPANELTDDDEDDSSEDIIFEGQKKTQANQPRGGVMAEDPISLADHSSEDQALPSELSSEEYLLPDTLSLPDLVAEQSSKCPTATTIPHQPVAVRLPSAPTAKIKPPQPNVTPHSPAPSTLRVSRGNKPGPSTQPDPLARGSHAPEPKSKMTLASSFTQGNDRKFNLLDKQLEIDQSRRGREASQAERERNRADRKDERESSIMEKRLNFDEARLKRQDDKEEKAASEASKKEDRLRGERKEMVTSMMAEGRSTSDIAALVKLVFG
ncbi:uncharacterized protein PGTG_01841 [Puccinia graminis f. sp. tritici CRL 75-36-700-3]|uniref:Uncharacterized protein n=1 Tax=Puccinia graminis f. sp. tritici (strain CRL 75-36-700-3 / race SCCL) TaxID=418459 RepID=E3JT21_PUCGT|nr:uncharacterized protein PGTG_01841 [Puccinia graminis f. sp. tritici CRL 75-36-700-3]EFP75248.2 hypothetical protein PGTG_01841 [Puccinia graminis f. sp. tritici CRL 75-36-700-3]